MVEVEADDVVEEEEEEEEEDEEVDDGCLGVAIPIAALNCSSIFLFFFFFLFMDDSLICWCEPCTVIPCMPKTALPMLFLSL